MSDAASLRSCLAAFLGDDRFRKLVYQLRRDGHLRYWQEGAWDRFVAAHPEHDCPLDALLAALRVCELHGGELAPGTVEVVEGCADYVPEYSRARAERFPNAASGPVFTQGAPRASLSGTIWFCEECRRAEAEWRDEMSRGGADPDLRLVQPTTLYEYAEAYELHKLSGQGRDRWAALRAEVEDAMAGGGRLWEWESPGFRALVGVCGLAVVRDGVVVRSWRLGVS